MFKKVFPISKKKALPTSSGIATAMPLTPEDHLLRQLSLRYFVDKSLSLKEVARRLEVPPKRIKEFFEDEEYRVELQERIERVHGIDSEFMQSQAKISLISLYEEMRKREAEGNLKDVPMRDLHKMIVDVQKELRLDTPGAFTSKVGVADLTRLQDRYKKSLSGKISRFQGIRNAKNVTPGESLLAEKGSNLDVESSNQNNARGTL